MNNIPNLPADVVRLEGPLTLYDGTTIHVRAIRADDDERLRAFHRQLSPDTIVLRFFHFLPELPTQDAEHFTHLDYVNRMALIATTGEGEAEEILGVVRYDRIREATAEVAFVIVDRWQGRGIATALLHRLAAYARTKGYTTFVAVTMGSNARMIEVLRNSGFPWTPEYSDGTLEVQLDITKPPTTSWQ
ncbi:MAG TPA: GNAT family N-acetyltransferase [Ktedonobacterales bacterium]|nr:GNAT family N-acetyltransferase [Ktedonobacterales bacterium]